MASSYSLPPEDSFRLREYLGILRVRKWSVILVTLLAVGGALLYAQQQTPQYTSTITVIAQDPMSVIDAAGGKSTGPDMSVQPTLVTSLPVRQCAYQVYVNPQLNQLNADLSTICNQQALAQLPVPGQVAAQPSASAQATASPSPEPTTSAQATASPTSSPQPLTLGFGTNIAVGVPSGSTLLHISDSDTKRVVAQQTAQAFALAYQFYVVDQAQQELALRAQKPADQQVTLQKQKASLTAQQNADIRSGNIPGANAAGDQINSINQQLLIINESLAAISPSKITPPQVVSPAPLPTTPSSPNKVLDGLIGLFVGLTAGIGLALLRERLDDGLRGRGDLEDRVGTPVLAVIPKISGWRRKQEARLVTLAEPKSAAAEAYRTLRTSVLFASVQRGLRTIMVVSPGAGDGKTTTAANLAVVLADAGKRVILVSADLRKPRINQFFGLANEVGVTSVLAGEVKPWDALQSPTVENLRVLEAGPVPNMPAELLASEAMGELVADLREVADFVILDTAPILLVADALALSPLVDGVLIVADAESTSRSAVTNAREQLDQVGAPLFGAVLNDFDPSKARAYPNYGGYYGYRQRYGYQYGAGYDGGTAAPEGETRWTTKPQAAPAPGPDAEERRTS
jgi:capsular exopolysaccharide synthesis family protein